MKARLTRVFGRVVVVAWLCAGWAPVAASQDLPTLPPADEALKIHGLEGHNLERLLEQRERGTLHPGVPLDLIGNEEGDNGFRAATPLLTQVDRTPALVDREENYNRRRALYEEGACFSAPLALAAPSVSRPRTHAPPPPAKAPELAGEAGDKRGLGLPLLLGVPLALLLAALAWKYRYALAR
jgi:hypothetical protein